MIENQTVSPGFWRSYGRRWARAPRELAYLVVIYPIAVAAFSLVWALFWSGIGLLPVFFLGLLLLIPSLYLARGVGTVDLVLLEWAGQKRTPRPAWRDRLAGSGFVGWLRALFANPHYWLYLLYVGFVQFVVSTVSFVLTVTWFSIALGGATWWFWSIFLPLDDADGGLGWVLHRAFGWDTRASESIAYLVLGVIFLVTLPYLTRGLTSLHGVIARGMLGRFATEELEHELAATEGARSAAVAAEGTSLRRLERDIHDGPQQRLVRLQMDLAAAERQLDADPEAARTLLGEARGHAQDALDELRALSRGLVPPILQDRGLVPALESAALRSPVATRVVDDLPAGIRLDAEVERTLYFAASEALANAIKHAGATSIKVRVAAEDGGYLASVIDDGVGGAQELPGHGLAGLVERLRGMGGSLTVSSPTGGPTVVTARVPAPTLEA